MKKIVIMPGGFHPFHAGHLALYKSAVEAFPGADVYVAASDNQKDRPFPFKVKEALATVAGIPKGKFVQVKSPFRPEEITKHYNSSEDALIFVRSDKDRREHPKPGGTKKDGSPAYYQAYNEKNLKPFAEEGYIAYLPTVEFADGMTSATEIRNAWPKLDELSKIEMIKSMYPGSELSVPKVKKLVQMLDAVLGAEQVAETFVDPDQSKQYWNHDSQRDVNTELEMPLRDNDRRGRRQGFNESDEIPVIYEKTVEALVSKFEGHESDFDSREELADSIEKKLSHLRVPDVVDPEFEVHGQPIGNYSSGRVIDVVSSNDVVDAVMQQLEYYDREDERNYVSEGVGKNIAVGALTLGALAGGAANATDITYDDIFNKHYTAEIQKMEERGYNLTDRDADGYNPSLKRQAKRIAKLKAQQEIQKLSPADSPIAKQIEKTRTELPQTNFDNYMPSRINESIDKIRGMIKETTDEQKSRSVDLHRKLFELMEEEKNNVVKLRGFGREADKKVVDINKVRAEKNADQERENNYYSERRAEQEELLARLQAELLNAKQEFAELADAKLLPIEMLDTMESITKLIDYIENWPGSDDQNDFPFTESILEKLQLKTVQLKEYFGGMRDRSAPRVLRKQEPTLTPKDFWNKVDLSETSDYIEEK